MSRQLVDNRQGLDEDQQAEIAALEAQIQALNEEYDSLPNVKDLENESHQIHCVIRQIQEGMFHDEEDGMFDDEEDEMFDDRFLTRQG